MIENDVTSVRVALRIRPQLAREKIEGCRNCTRVTPGEPQVTLQDKAFTYDYLFDTPTEQHTVYDSCISSLVEGCFEGYNATVLAYGQTGSGKTYTMGTGFDVTSSPEELGVIPRAMQHLFKGIAKRKEEALQSGLPTPEFQISAQFVELYNEEVIDLFDTTRGANKGKSNIRIHEDSNGNIYTVGVTTQSVSSAEETLKCLHSGALNRTTAATQMNSQSSRSHAIFSIHMKQTRACKPDTANSSENAATTPDSECKSADAMQSKSEATFEFETLCAKFHFTDLAGSERLKRTGATGERAKEGISINCGLLALGNVISALGDVTKKGSHVPYRDSKLTRLLQDSLGGNSCTLMIACVSPSDSEFVETLNTLKYANRARNIKNKVTANQDSTSKQVQVLRQQIAALQLELTEYKTGKRIVGEDGVEAYNDMFQENNMLQKEIDNFRMKIKAMQSTIDNQKLRIVDLTAEAAQVKIVSTDKGNGDAVSMIKTYISEIEELRSKLVESEALCSTLRRKSDSASPFTRILSPRPVPMAASIDFESPVMVNGKSVLELAKDNIHDLEQEKSKLKSKGRSEKKEESKNDNSVQNGQGEPTLNGHTSDLSASENDTEAEDEGATTDDDGDEEEELDDDDEELPETIQNQFATLTYEIDVKQQLINQLELMQTRLSSMQRQYEDKLKLMSDKIKAVEVERDKVLNGLSTTKNSGTNEQANKVKAQYKKQLDTMKKEMSKLQEAKKSHDRLIREQSKHMNQLRSLRVELDQMKKTKIRLLRQMKDEQKRNKVHESKQSREIMKLKREFRQKTNKIHTLETKSKQKDVMMKRKQEELALLRRQLKPISGKFGKQLAAKQANLDATFVVDKTPMPVSTQPPSRSKRERKVSSEFSSRTARVKWKSVQSKVEEVVVQRETIARIERQMQRFMKDRERLQRDIQLAHRKRTRAAIKGESMAVCQQLKDEEDTLQENMDYVNEQIQECQMEIVQVEESMEDNGSVIGVIQNCSVNEARYLLENLLSLAISKSAVGVQSQSKVEDLQSRLNESQQSAKQAHDIMRYMLEEKPNLDASLVDCLNEYMKGTNSESSSVSSRDSSPTRQENSFETFSPSVIAAPDQGLNVNSEAGTGPKEVKARRRTATPQQLLHGMSSPLQRRHLNARNSPDDPTLVVNEKSGPGTSTPDTVKSPNETITAENVDDGMLDELPNGNSFIPRKRLGTYTIDEDSPSLANEKKSPTNETPTSSPMSDAPPSSPLITNRSAITANVFSRLTTYAINSPRSDKGRMNPYSSKAPTPRSAPLLCRLVAEGHHKAVLSIQATDHLLFSASKDRSVKVWNLVTGQEIMSLDGHPNNVNIVRHCPHTGLVYSVSLCYIKIWDIRSRAKCIRVLSTSGAHHMPGTFMGSMQRTNKMPDNEFQINDVKLSPDSKQLFCAASTSVKIWDLNKFAVMGKLSGHTGNIMTMVVPRNETSTVITGAKDHFIKVYDLSNGIQGIISPSMTMEPPHMDGVESLVFSSSSNVLFSGSRDKSIKKWNMKAKSVIKSQYQAHANWVCALDIVQSEDGDEVLVSGGRGGLIKLWDAESFGTIGDMRAHTDTVNCIASNSTNIFTASSDATIKVWKRKPDR